jgi:hypothetical protein
MRGQTVETERAATMDEMNESLQANGRAKLTSVSDAETCDLSIFDELKGTQNGEESASHPERSTTRAFSKAPPPPPAPSRRVPPPPPRSGRVAPAPSLPPPPSRALGSRPNAPSPTPSFTRLDSAWEDADDLAVIEEDVDVPGLSPSRPRVTPPPAPPSRAGLTPPASPLPRAPLQPIAAPYQPTVERGIANTAAPEAHATPLAPNALQFDATDNPEEPTSVSNPIVESEDVFSSALVPAGELPTVRRDLEIPARMSAESDADEDAVDVSHDESLELKDDGPLPSRDEGAHAELAPATPRLAHEPSESFRAARASQLLERGDTAHDVAHVTAPPVSVLPPPPRPPTFGARASLPPTPLPPAALEAPPPWNSLRDSRHEEAGAEVSEGSLLVRDPVTSLAPVAPTTLRPQRAPKTGWIAAAAAVGITATAAAVALLAWPGRGELIVTVAGPRGVAVPLVEIAVNGEVKCETSPCRVALSPGAHLVKVTAAGYEKTADRPVRVERGEAAILEVALSRADFPESRPLAARAEAAPPPARPLSAASASEPPSNASATTEAGTAAAAPTPEAEPERAAAAPAATAPATRRATKASTARAPTAKAPSTTRVGSGNDRATGQGKISLASIPAASVVIDGRPAGQTPVTLSVAPGMHTVVFVHPQRGRKVVSVQVVAGKTSPASVRF